MSIVSCIYTYVTTDFILGLRRYRVCWNKPRIKSVVTVFVIVLLFGGFFPAHAEESVTPEIKPYAESYVGETETHIAVYEDTLVNLARDNDLGFVELRAANPALDPWMPGEGTEITLPKRHVLPQAPRDGVVINLPEMRLYAFVNKGEPPITHPLGVGRVGLETPIGSTSVVRKKIGPTWRPTARMREENPELPVSIGPGSDNPLGTHALYLGWPQYALHGTNRPFGIGRRVSSGCIRLYPEDILSLFDMVPEGMSVTVVDQPIKVGWVGNDLYMEAHPSLAQADEMEQSGFVSSYEFTSDDSDVLMSIAGEFADLIDWSAVRKIVRTRRGVPVVIATKPAPILEGNDNEETDDQIEIQDPV